jgi:adenylate cyclase class 2
MNLEIEIKLKLRGSVQAARRQIRSAGFEIHVPRVFETNALFDTGDQKLRTARELLRVRTVRKTGILTFKGVPQASKFKSREELEVQVSDPERLESILSRLGFERSFRYEKFRTEYKQAGKAGIVTLDETPIGNYFELEGKPVWIDRTARRLGFKETDYITLSYGRLYQLHCQEQGVEPTNMRFMKRT